MKTITEFSGTVLRLAAQALASAKASLPPEPAPSEGAPADAAPPPESDEAKAAINDAIAKETGLKGDRLSLVRGALTAAGNKLADVRLVRVYAGEEAVPGAKKIGEHQFVLDVLPQSMKPQFARPEKEKHGGRGGRGQGGGRGSSEGPPTGGFSMDSLKSDKGGGRGRGPGGPKK